MPHASRYVRPERAPPLLLQVRDRGILASVFAHRYLSAAHVHELLFPCVALRQVQSRLRKLWAHRFLDRFFIPFILDGETLPPTTAGRPFYRLASAGAAVVADALGIDPATIPQTAEQNAAGFGYLEHNLVVTDLLVALMAACRGRSDVALVGIERETELRRRVGVFIQTAIHRERALVPDGAFNLSYGTSSPPMTFYVEIVRAGVRGGNALIAERLRLYAEAHHRGFFRRVYGHDRLRAVLFLTTSTARANRFRQFAAALPHARALFWFGTYQGTANDGRVTSTLATDTILSARWATADGASISFIPHDAGTVGPRAGPLT